MTISQKASLSLLISVFFFAIFTVVSFAGLFDLVETRFYNPSITKNVSRELEQDTRVIQDFITELDNRFSAVLENEAVKRSVLPNQSAEDIFERSRLFGTLMESLGGLQSIRFIDAAGRRIHYSTLPSDLFYQDRLSISYRNYDEENEAFSYSDISVSNEANTKLTLDSQQDRILFSLPFYDSYNIFRGTALFSLSVRAFSDRLLSEGLIKYGEDVSIISGLSGGLVIGMPRTGKESPGKDSLVNAVMLVWNEGITSLTPLDSETGELSFALISSKTDQSLFVGKVVDEALFAFPFAMKIILLVSFFLTIYLIIFLLFNIKQDSMTVIQNRLKRLQINLFEEYYERKGDMDWSRWSKELERRRDEVRNELKRGINIKKSRHNNKDIDTLIDKSWDEMTAVMSAQGQPQITANIDEDKLSSILNRVLAAAGTAAAKNADSVQEIKPADKTQPAGSNPEAMEELEEIDSGEELEELEDLDADESLETVEDLEEIEEAEPATEVEELEELNDDEEIVAAADADESLETVEDLEEIEDAEPAADVEELEELNDDEEIVAAADADESLETVEDLEEIEDAEPAADVEELEELSDVEEIVAAADADESLETLDIEVLDDDVESEGSVEDAISLTEADESNKNRVSQKNKPISETELSKLASEIEFGDVENEGQDEDLDRPLEIYSPFDNILVEPGEEKEKDEQNSSAVLEEINPSYNMSLVYTPFQIDALENLPELEKANLDENTEQAIEEVPEENVILSGDSAQDEVIIEERDGVNYLTNLDIHANMKNVDSDFMNLVDSILNNKKE